MTRSSYVEMIVVVPCLNAHKRHVRDPLYSLGSLHGIYLKKTTPPATAGGVVSEETVGPG